MLTPAGVVCVCVCVRAAWFASHGLCCVLRGARGDSRVDLIAVEDDILAVAVDAAAKLWVCVTPDSDVYLEDLSDTSAEIDLVRIRSLDCLGCWLLFS